MSKIYPINGIRLGIARAHVRYPGRDDVCIIEIQEGGKCALITTQNRFAAAPIELCRRFGADNARYLIINTGNANAATGEMGRQNAFEVCDALAKATNCDVSCILPFSTGVIGEHLPIARIINALGAALDDLDASHWSKAARAIMTTDTRPKVVSARAGKYHITGISKGAGMIRPNMATMLGFVATDAPLSYATLKPLLKRLADKSFNRITIDGDTSTNDACVLISTGKGAPLDQNSAEFVALEAALTQVFLDLAHAIVKDGEGATKFITVKVTGAATQDDAAKCAYAVAHSPLVKTAIYASDPNWGRIAAAAGYAGVDFDATKVNIYLDTVCICQGGALATEYTEAQGQKVMARDEVTIHLDLGQGNAQDTVYTCDLSAEYVAINADYRS